MPLATHLGWAVTCNEAFPMIKSCDCLIKWSCEVVCQIKCYRSIATMPMATKTDSVVNYLQGLSLINSYDPLIRTFWKTT